MRKIDNKELNKLISECKSSVELKELQIALCNETIGKIDNKQALKILNAQHELEKIEQQKILEMRNARKEYQL